MLNDLLDGRRHCFHGGIRFPHMLSANTLHLAQGAFRRKSIFPEVPASYWFARTRRRIERVVSDLRPLRYPGRDSDESLVSRGRTAQICPIVIFDLDDGGLWKRFAAT